MSKQNGSKQTETKQNGHKLIKPRRPRPYANDLPTPEEAQAYEDYLKQLREWLDALSDEEHDRAFIHKLTSMEQEHVTTMITYDNYQKGGPLRELLEGTCLEGTL
ncbi:MAG: hypothetical protein HOP19_23380 [Acidobacteria bacterium]|nr:hypothetical protein [Acidobacteriota bacterium]